MPTPIRLEKFDEKQRQGRRIDRLPARDQSEHGGHLASEMMDAIATFKEQIEGRTKDMPNVPEGIQILLKGATTATGNALLDSQKLLGLKLEILEERSEGVIIALSSDPNLRRLSQAVDDFRNDARTIPTAKRPQGTRKPGVPAIFSIDDIRLSQRALRIGEELSEVAIDILSNYVVDIEIAAGSELGDESLARQHSFSEYLRQAGGSIFGNGPIVEEDYALYRAQVGGRLLTDLLDVHVWVKSIDLPPEVERDGLELYNMQESTIPPITTNRGSSPAICVIDSGIARQHPLLRESMKGKPHKSFIPKDTSTGDPGKRGHGTAGRKYRGSRLFARRPYSYRTYYTCSDCTSEGIR